MVDPRRAMTLDEALAVYEYLKLRAPGDRNAREERMFSIAWETIFKYAQQAIAEC
jgi:hypothetical protein